MTKHIVTSAENASKRKELEDHFDRIEKEGGTCRVEVHWKDGRLCSGNLYLPILK